MDTEFGQWEMYTKGVGSKLLQKMGYQHGKGLGKNLQGIIEPIEAKKRPGAGSIGLYGPESTTTKPRKGVDLVKDAEMSDDNEEEVTNRKAWKRNDKTIKCYTKSFDDIIKDSLNQSWNNQNSDLTGVKIIDMTGPEQRMLTGLSQLHQSKPEKPKDDYEITDFNTRFDVPELKQNIQRLILLSEKNLMKRKHEHDYNLNNICDLKEETVRLEQLISELKKKLDNLEKFSDFIASLEDIQHTDEQLTVEIALTKFEIFFTDELKNELKLLKIDNLILCIFNGILRQELRKWHPFDLYSIDYLSLFKRLKNLVYKSRTFEILLWNNWFPAVSRSLQCWPSMKNYEPIILFVNNWRPVLPKWLYEHFIVNNLISRLQKDVEEWNPLTDTVTIHSWIHPWLPVILVSDDTKEELNYLFEPIYTTIRMKLSKALTNWHPSDSSARLILEPWKNVFTESSMQTFLDRNIAPKLEQAIQSMTINPNQQSINEWNWVLSWQTLISLHTIVSILERFFFPKWLKILYIWLSSGAANFAEVSSWYQSWKNLMGEQLVNHITVKDYLKKALIMMDHAVNLNTGLKNFATYLNSSTINEPATQPEPKPQPIPSQPNPLMQMNIPAGVTINNDQLSFRNMVEMKAAENGILFMPLANRFEDGRQIFKFGQYLIYIDNQVIFYQKYSQGKRIWQPIRIADLVQMC